MSQSLALVNYQIKNYQTKTTFKMYVHVRYGAHKETTRLQFNHNFVTVADVMEKAKKNYGSRTRLKLLNEYRVQMKDTAMVEKGRVYQINRL